MCDVLPDTLLCEQGQSALHVAVMMNRMLIVELLIRRGVNVDAADVDGTTPLHWAAFNVRTTKSMDAHHIHAHSASSMREYTTDVGQAFLMCTDGVFAGRGPRGGGAAELRRQLPGEGRQGTHPAALGCR